MRSASRRRCRGSRRGHADAEKARLHPGAQAEVREGYRGLANEFPGQESAPRRKPKDFGAEVINKQYCRRQCQRRRSSHWVPVELPEPSG